MNTPPKKRVRTQHLKKIAFLALLGASSLIVPELYADEPTTNAAKKTEIVTIPSPIPSYMDRGRTMVPLKPITDFLGVEVRSPDGLMTLTRTDSNTGKPLVVTFRFGQLSAQVNENSQIRTIQLDKAPESRLGNGFVPIRFITAAFGVPVSFRVPDNAIVLRTQDKIGILTPSNPPEYKEKNAATVVITNRIGRALSIQLSGPQKIAIELGHGQSLTRKLPPGVYSYRAAISNMKPRTGKRRFYAKKRSYWSWGKR